MNAAIDVPTRMETATISSLAELDAAVALVLPLLRHLAQAVDEAATYPRDSFAILRREGFLKLALPKSLGGLGFGEDVPFAVYFDLLRQLASACSNTAQIYSVHANALLTIQRLGGAETVARFAEAVALEGATFCYVGSEPTDRFDPTGKRVSFSSYAEQTVEGWKVTAQKIFATGSLAARWALIHVSADARPESEGWLLVPLDLRRPEVTLKDDWDNIGQRATTSGSIVARDYPLLEDEVIGGPGAVPRDNTLGTLYQLSFGAMLTGMAQAALEFAVDYVNTQRRPTDGYERTGDEPYVQLRIADMAISVSAARALLTRASGLYDRFRQSDEALIYELMQSVYELKAFVSEKGVQISSDLLVLCGARGTAARYASDRFWRNARTLSLHDNLDKQKATIGRQVLGVGLPAVGIR